MLLYTQVANPSSVRLSFSYLQSSISKTICEQGSAGRYKVIHVEPSADRAICTRTEADMHFNFIADLVMGYS